MPVALQGILYMHDDSDFPPRGWSEVYNLVATSYSVGIANMQTITTVRMAMCINTTRASYIRVSDLYIKGDSAIATPTTGIGTYVLASLAAQLPPDSALIVRQEAGPLRRSFRYIHSLTSQDVFGNLWTPTPAMATAISAYLTQLNNLTIQRHKNVGPPVTYTDTAWTLQLPLTVNSRKIGRPFGVPRGRRLIA